MHERAAELAQHITRCMRIPLMTSNFWAKRDFLNVVRRVALHLLAAISSSELSALDTVKLKVSCYSWVTVLPPCELIL